MASDEDETLWSSVPWQTGILAWHKHCVPYKMGANALQNLDVWVPHHASSSLPTKGNRDEPPPLSTLQGTWVIYIHGGAWRDPLETSTSFTATLNHMLQKGNSTSPSASSSKIAAFASLNYSLSAHPSHPSSDPSRNTRHPQHILDVRRAIGFLQRLAHFGTNYVLLGHSCGATLTFQVIMDAMRWERTKEEDSGRGVVVEKPRAAIGLNGLYDLPGLVHNPGEKHARWSDIYAEFTTGAFGADETVWRQVSPFYVRDWVVEWGRADAKVVLVQSREDTLVPYRQLEGMMTTLEAEKAKGLEVLEMAASGDHTELWEKGDRLAEIIEEVIKML